MTQGENEQSGAGEKPRMTGVKKKLTWSVVAMALLAALAKLYAEYDFSGLLP